MITPQPESSDARIDSGSVKALAARLFRRELAPGRFETGAHRRARLAHDGAARAGGRDYLVYVPRGYSRWRRAPLVVLCHGCRQTPEDFAALTRIAERADREGWLVLLPRQADGANAWGCWNWFDANTSRGAGEAAIVAAQIVAVRRQLSRAPRTRLGRGAVGGRRARRRAGRALSAARARRARAFGARLRRRVDARDGADGHAARPGQRRRARSPTTRARPQATRRSRSRCSSSRATATTSSRRSTASALVDQFLRFNAHAAGPRRLPACGGAAAGRRDGARSGQRRAPRRAHRRLDRRRPRRRAPRRRRRPRPRVERRRRATMRSPIRSAPTRSSCSLASPPTSRLT